MGHVPSSEVKEPYFMDLYSSKNGCERLAAIALTDRYFKSAEDPLFVKFCQTRAENPVRHWYCRPGDSLLDELPEVPSNEDLYSRFVLDASSVVDLNLPPNQYNPIPIMIVKMDEHTHKPQNSILPDATNCHVIGYYGCRAFGSRRDGKPAPLGSCSVMGIFLSTKFYNEAKSLACVQLACSCYKYFCEKAGCREKPWPAFSFKFDTLDANLPCLRLTQKLLAAVGNSGISCAEEHIVIEKGEGRCFFDVAEEGVQAGGDLLAGNVKVEISGTDSRNVLRTTQIALPEGTNLPNGVQNLNAYISEAKSRWSEVNAPVVQKQLENGRQARGEGKKHAKGARTENLVEHANSNITTIPLAPVPVAGGGTTSQHQAPPALSSPTKATVVFTAQGENNVHAMPTVLNTNEIHAEGGGGRDRRNSQTSAYSHDPYSHSGHDSPTHHQQQQQAGSANSAFFGSTHSSYPDPHYPRAPVPLQRHDSQLSTHQPAYEQYRQQQQQQQQQQFGSFGSDQTSTNSSMAGSAPSSVIGSQQDPRVFLGERTPVYVCTLRKKWEARYWRNPMAPLTRSQWQPHLPQFVCFEIDHQDLLLYDEFWQPITNNCEPLIFMEVGESCYTLDDKANYVASQVA